MDAVYPLLLKLASCAPVTGTPPPPDSSPKSRLFAFCHHLNLFAAAEVFPLSVSPSSMYVDRRSHVSYACKPGQYPGSIGQEKIRPDVPLSVDAEVWERRRRRHFFPFPFPSFSLSDECVRDRHAPNYNALDRSQRERENERGVVVNVRILNCLPRARGGNVEGGGREGRTEGGGPPFPSPPKGMPSGTKRCTGYAAQYSVPGRTTVLRKKNHRE